MTVDVLTTPVVSGGRALTGRTRGVPLPRAVSRGVIDCLLTLLVGGLVRINVDPVALRQDVVILSCDGFDPGPVAGGTRLHPRQLLLDLGNLLLEGGHVFGRRFLVFEDVVVFGIVVFGGLSFVVGFFLRGLSLDFRVSGVAMRTPAPFFVPVEDIGEGFPKRDFGRNSKGTLFNVFQNRRSPMWLVWGFVPKITWRKGSISQ